MQPKLYTIPNDKNILKIWRGSVKNEALSKKEGVDVFDSAIYISIISPGATKQEFATIVERVDRDGNVRTHKPYCDDYKVQIDQFKANQDDNFAHGTPLSALPFMDPAVIDNLKRLGVYTAEQFKGMEGTALQAVGMGAEALKRKVVSYLEAAQGAAPIIRLENENKELREKIARLEETVSALAAAKKKKEAA